jgi:glycosyltransferase involved in cell wall biosynthesis
LIGTVYDHAKLTSLRYHSFAYLHGHSVGGTNPSLLEAMGCRNLIVAHDNPFNRETLGDSALFFTEVADLKTTLDTMESADFSWPDLRSKAQRRAAEDYSWPLIAAQYENLLRSTVQHPRLPRSM